MNWRIAAHFIFETLGYAAGFRLYLGARRREGDFLGSETRTWIVVAAILGAALGSRILFWFENPLRTFEHAHDIGYLLSGKTIVGGLLGGTMAVEWTKCRLGLYRRTGDLFAIPMAIGIAIGRIGCFFGGLQDDTYGIPSNLPWAVDFGDGIPRHPTQLYETAVMLILAAWLHHREIHLGNRAPLDTIEKQATAGYRRLGRPQKTMVYPTGRCGPRAHVGRRQKTIVYPTGTRRMPEGGLYRYFLTSYLAWRLAIDFLKPGIPFAGLTVIQWVCAVALTWYVTHPIQQLEPVHG